MIAKFGKNGNSDFFNQELMFKTIGIIVLIIIALLIVADIKIYNKKRELKEVIRNYQEKIDHIKNSSETLKEEIANANNIDYLEKLGYEQFDRTRPGETEYMFIDSPENTEKIQEQENLKKNNFWFGWIGQSWQWIKSRF